MKDCLTIFLDMDDVLCDFTGSVMDLFSMPDAVIDRWNLEEIIGISPEAFWDKIQKDGGFEFWENMKPLPHYKELIEIANKYPEL